MVAFLFIKIFFFYLLIFYKIDKNNYAQLIAKSYNFILICYENQIILICSLNSFLRFHILLSYIMFIIYFHIF